MRIIPLLALALLGACATPTRHTDALMDGRGKIPQDSHVEGVPLVSQTRNHCGPAALAMVMGHTGRPMELERLTARLFSEKMQGTFQADMLGAAREDGMLALPVRGFREMLEETSAGNPVIVFQNLAFNWSPQWHYAVLTGHDLSGPDVFLHTDGKADQRTDMRVFERSWLLGGRWALVVLPPGRLSATAGDKEHARAAAWLEKLGHLDAAQASYRAILARWPHSLGARLGLANLEYAKRNFRGAVAHLEDAVEHHPHTAVAWHNLAIAQGDAGQKSAAQASAARALKLAGAEEKNRYQTSLSHWLANH